MKTREIIKIILLNSAFSMLFTGMIIFRVSSVFPWLTFFGTWLYLNSLVKLNLRLEFAHWVVIILGITLTAILILGIT